MGYQLNLYKLYDFLLKYLEHNFQYIIVGALFLQTPKIDEFITILIATEFLVVSLIAIR